MDISIQNAARTQFCGFRHGAGSLPGQPFETVPGILTAPNIIVLGASIMSAGFGGSSTLRSGLQDYAWAAGFTGTLHTRAASGDNIADTRARLADIKADPVLQATEGQNLYIVHTGGNNVSGPRPYPGGADTFTADYDSLMQDITSTDAVIPLPLTKRLYVAEPQVLDGDVDSEENGSKPYNENIIYPAIDQYAPDWRAAGQVPYANPYALADRWPQLLSEDGVHGYSASIARFILARIAARAMGHASGQSRSGMSILYSPQKGSPDEIGIGPINRMVSNGNGRYLNYPLLCGAIALDGGFEPFIEVTTNDVFQNASTNAGADTYARIADTRFHDLGIVNQGIYVQEAQVYELEFGQLTPGDTVRVSAVGVRNSGGASRRGVISLSDGQSLELDASNIAGSNQVTLAPVTVPSDGRLTLGLSVAAGSTYGYLHGVLLEFL